MKGNSKNLSDPLESQNSESSQQQEVVREEEEAMESAATISSESSEKLSECDSKEFLKEKMENYWEQLLRLQAEFANYRKRTEKEKTEAIRFGREIMIEKLISLTDVMESAIKHSQNATDLHSLKKGFEMVYQEFLSFLKSEGAQPLKTVGESFNPHWHEAVEQIKTDKEEENNLILEEVQKGYSFNGHLLRAAKVKVAKKA